MAQDLPTAGRAGRVDGRVAGSDRDGSGRARVPGAAAAGDTQLRGAADQIAEAGREPDERDPVLGAGVQLDHRLRFQADKLGDPLQVRAVVANRHDEPLRLRLVVPNPGEPVEFGSDLRQCRTAPTPHQQQRARSGHHLGELSLPARADGHRQGLHPVVVGDLDEERAVTDGSQLGAAVHDRARLVRAAHVNALISAPAPSSPARRVAASSAAPGVSLCRHNERTCSGTALPSHAVTVCRATICDA